MTIEEMKARLYVLRDLHGAALREAAECGIRDYMPVALHIQRDINRYVDIINAVPRDGDGHELDTPDNAEHDEEYRASNREELRRWAERLDADDHRPARQHGGL